MRGLAVLLMIEAHLIDSWTAPASRGSRGFAWAMILGGFAAPLFLFMAGVSVALSAGSKYRRDGNAQAAGQAVARRGLEIFGLAFLFRVQAWILGLSSPRKLLRVDILNIMGPSISAAALLWSMARSVRARYLVFLGAALSIAFLTPVVRSTPLLSLLPDAVEGYIRPVQGITTFAFFPWSGFVFAGAFLGVAIDASRTPQSERRLNLLFAAAGFALAAAAYGASFLPSPYAHSEFWTSSPAFFLLRTGLMTIAVALAYTWSSSRRDGAWSPMQQFGRTSLFVYWIHVELVYGLVSTKLHGALSLRTAWVAFALFCVLMLGCSLAKDRVLEWWRRRPSRPASPARASLS